MNFYCSFLSIECQLRSQTLTMGHYHSRLRRNGTSTVQQPYNTQVETTILPQKHTLSYIQTRLLGTRKKDKGKDKSRDYNQTSNSSTNSSQPPYTSATPTITTTTTPAISPPTPTTPRKKRSELSTTTRRRSLLTRKTDEEETTLHSFLQEFDLVFVVDDSTSMRGERWQEIQSVLAGITPLCAQYNYPTGIDMYFLNHHSEETLEEDDLEPGKGVGGYMHLTSAEEIRAVFENVGPRGRTPFGRRLEHVLAPYLRLVENMMIASHSHNLTLTSTSTGAGNQTYYVKPLYIVGITDGAFTDDAERVLVGAMQRLQACRAVGWQVKVQFFQVGMDDGARRFLEVLEGNLRREGVGRGVLMVDGNVSGGGGGGKGRLNAEGLLRGVIRAVGHLLG